MAKSNNQKAKLLFLERMLRETGENRAVSMQEILEMLMSKGIRAERKSIYDDLDALRAFGMDIQFKRGRPGGYYMAGQMAPEMPVMEDPREKVSGGRDLQEDDAQKGSSRGKDSQDRDSQQDDSKKDGSSGKASREAGKKPETPALPVPKFEREATGDRKKQMRLLCAKEKEWDVRAFFGKSAEYKAKDDASFTVTAPNMSSPQFFGWLTAMGREVHIVKPKKTAAAYRDYLKALAKEYKGI